MLRPASLAGRSAVVLLLLAAAPAAGEPALKAGADFTVGSGDYYEASSSAEAAWKNPSISPFARARVMADTFQSALSVGGGAVKSLPGGLDLTGGLGLTVGRVWGADQAGKAVTLMAGAEKPFGDPILGCDYRFTSGSIGTSDYGRIGRGRAGRGAGGATSHPEDFTAHQVGGYGRLPVEGATLGARLTVYFPSNDATSVSETLSLAWPLSEALSVSLAVNFEQAAVSATYFTPGIRYQF